MHILIFDIGFHEKVKKNSYFQRFLYNFFTFYLKNPKRPNRQSANMAHFVAFCIGFQKNIPLQNPPWGEGGGYMAAQGLYYETEDIKNAMRQRDTKSLTERMSSNNAL